LVPPFSSICGFGPRACRVFPRFRRTNRRAQASARGPLGHYHLALDLLKKWPRRSILSFPQIRHPRSGHDSPRGPRAAPLHVPRNDPSPHPRHHQRVSVSHIHLLEPSALVQEPSRILGMNDERDPRMLGAGGAGQRLAQERLAVADRSMGVLVVGLERDAQLPHRPTRAPCHGEARASSRLRHRRRRRPRRRRSRSRGPSPRHRCARQGTEGSRPAAAALAEDPRAQHGASAMVCLDRPQRVDGSGAAGGVHDLEFRCRCVGMRLVLAEVLCRG
jgi:hypothetical protein